VISSTFGSNNGDQPTVLSYVPGDWYYIALTASYDPGTGATIVNWYGADLSASETTIQHYGTFDYAFSGDWTGTTSIGVGVFNNGTQEFMDGRLDNTALTCGILTPGDFQARLNALYVNLPSCQTAGIAGDPTDQAVETPNTATFSVAATGTSPAYQWQVSTNSGALWENVLTGTGGTTASYTTDNLCRLGQTIPLHRQRELRFQLRHLGRGHPDGDRHRQLDGRRRQRPVERHEQLGHSPGSQCRHQGDHRFRHRQLQHADGGRQFPRPGARGRPQCQHQRIHD
jgi:hypothetical protein